MALYKGDSIARWLEQATGKIKFPPDCDKVRRELREHIEDRIEGFILSGDSREQAEAKAIEAMGNPEEIAEDFARLYRPFWGYFAKCTRVVKNILVCYLIFLVAANYPYCWDVLQKQFLPYERAVYEIPQYTRSFSGKKAKIGDYTLEITDMQNYASGSDRYIGINITVKNINPQLQAPLFYHHIYGKDNLNNLYDQWWQDNEIGNEISVNYMKSAWFSSVYYLTITDVDPKASEMTIMYDRFGQSFEITIPIAKEAE